MTTLTKVLIGAAVLGVGYAVTRPKKKKKKRKPTNGLETIPGTTPSDEGPPPDWEPEPEPPWPGPGPGQPEGPQLGGIATGEAPPPNWQQHFNDNVEEAIKVLRNDPSVRTGQDMELAVGRVLFPDYDWSPEFEGGAEVEGFKRPAPWQVEVMQTTRQILWEASNGSLWPWVGMGEKSGSADAAVTFYVSAKRNVRACLEEIGGEPDVIRDCAASRTFPMKAWPPPEGTQVYWEDFAWDRFGEEVAGLIGT